MTIGTILKLMRHVFCFQKAVHPSVTIFPACVLELTSHKWGTKWSICKCNGKKYKEIHTKYLFVLKKLTFVKYLSWTRPKDYHLWPLILPFLTPQPESPFHTGPFWLACVGPPSLFPLVS